MLMNFQPKGLYVGGKWIPGAVGKDFVTINPANGQKLANVPWAGEEEVNLAVAAAKHAFAQWSQVPPAQRAGALETLASRILECVDELALIDAYDSGNAICGMRGDVRAAAETIKYFAGLARELKGETFSNGPNQLNYTVRQPYGVVAKINAFNHPLRFCAEKVAAPLIAGNSVVIKQPEQAPLSGLRFGELCEGLFPDGTINILTGDEVAGSALVRHPDVPRIGFIGSVPTARAIAREAADRLKHLSLELGGKNPIIIFADADVDQAVLATLKGMNLNRQGQSCSSTSRVFVHDSLHEQVVGKVTDAAALLPVGLPWKEGAEVGPIVSQAQFNRVMEFIASGKQQGARLTTGGGRPKDKRLAGGFFIEPTVFDEVTMDMRIGREEIFGPVISVLRWNDFDTMLKDANDVEYGLTASIVTTDMNLAMRTADKIQAGYVWINSTGRYLGAPYGGWKQSGMGREESLDELLSYTQIKNVNVAW